MAYGEHLLCCCAGDEEEENPFDCPECGCCGGTTVSMTIQSTRSVTAAALQAAGSPCLCLAAQLDYSSLEGEAVELSRCFCMCEANYFGNPDLIAFRSIYIGCSGPFTVTMFQNPDTEPCAFDEGTFNLAVTYKCSAIKRLSDGQVRRTATISIGLSGFTCDASPTQTCDQWETGQQGNCTWFQALAPPGIDDAVSEEGAFGQKTFDDCATSSTFHFDLEDEDGGVTGLFGVRDVLVQG